MRSSCFAVGYGGLIEESVSPIYFHPDFVESIGYRSKYYKPPLVVSICF